MPRIPSSCNIAVLVALLAPATATAQAEQEEFSGELEPRSILVFRVTPDPSDPGIEVTPPDATPLADEAIAVLELLPEWLARDLRAQLRLRPLGEQVRLAELIRSCPDDRLLDEVAFAAAHLAPEAAQVSDLGLLIDNAQLIYDTAELLDYVEIVEHEDPEPYTTLAYTFLGAEGTETWELPRDDYYWLVVHPMLDDEVLAPVNPTTGGRQNEGWFWRAYYQSDDENPLRSHRLHWSLRQPDPLTDDLLNGAGWTTAPAHGTLVEFEIGPIELVRDAESGAPVAATFVRGDGRCCDRSWPNPDGQVYVTLMPLEQVADEHPEPLRNLLDAGTDNMPLLSSTLVDAGWGSYEEEPRHVLIVRDRIPFGLEVDPNERILEELGRTAIVIDGATFAGLQLTSDEDPHVVLESNKIVIPSDQPRSLYELLAARAEDIERYVDYGGVFELHGATRPEDDWSDLRMPGGVHSTPQRPEGYISTVALAGFPDLLESLEGVEHVWDGVTVPGLSGDRLLDPSEGALSVVGWFVTQNMTTNVSEHSFWTRNPSPARHQQPVRLLWQHYGNCGELQDVLGAAGRTALLPVWLVQSMADDHVWNEFLAWDEFFPYQVDWSDGPTRLASWGVAADADTGGGKTISGMTGWRGDGWLENLLGRYEVEVDEEGRITGDYSRHATVVVRVTDDAGRPVDGALVVISTNGFYNPGEYAPATWSFTDLAGVAAITVGEDNNYWYRVRSDVGHFPVPAEGDFDPFDLDDRANQPLARAGDVVADAVLEEDVQLEGHIDAPMPTEVAPPEVQDAGGVRVTVNVTASRALMAGRSPYQLWSFVRESQPGSVDIFVVDQANLGALREGSDFEALMVVEDAAEGEHAIDLPAGNDYSVVVSNARRLTTTQAVDVQVALDPLTPSGDAGPDAGDDASPDGGDAGLDAGGGGCDCSAVTTWGRAGVVARRVVGL
jgi:hypothetical protein